MTENDMLARSLSELEDSIYFASPSRLPDRLQSQILEIAPGSLRIGAPGTVDLSKQEALPVLYVAGDSQEHRALVPPDLNVALLAVDLDRGTLRMTEAFPLDPSKTYPTKPARKRPSFLPRISAGPVAGPGGIAPPPTMPDSVAQSWLDFRKLGAVEWFPRRYALRVIRFDQISNAALVELVDPQQPSSVSGFPADVAQEIELAAHRTNAIEGGVARFKRSDASPKLDRPGAALFAPSQIYSGESPIAIHGAAKLALGGGMIVDPDLLEKEPTEAHIYEDDLPQAVVTVTLLVAEIDRVPARSIELRIPVDKGNAVEQGSAIDVAFSLDLHDALGGPLANGTYFLYLVAGEHVSGPHRLDVGEPPPL